MPREIPLRYSHGVSVPRRRGQRQLIGYSPKLKRRVTLLSHAAFEAWLILESDPKIVSFCEHPLLLETSEGSKLADFWVRFDDHEEFMALVQIAGADRLGWRVERAEGREWVS